MDPRVEPVRIAEAREVTPGDHQRVLQSVLGPVDVAEDALRDREEPVAAHFGWDLVWFGVILTLKVSLGQFTPPLAVNLMVSCKIAGVSMESTVRYVVWLLGAMFIVMLMVLVYPPLATWLPGVLGY